MVSTLLLIYICDINPSSTLSNNNTHTHSTMNTKLIWSAKNQSLEEVPTNQPNKQQQKKRSLNVFREISNWQIYLIHIQKAKRINCQLPQVFFPCWFVFFLFIFLLLLLFNRSSVFGLELKFH